MEPTPKTTIRETSPSSPIQVSSLTPRPRDFARVCVQARMYDFEAASLFDPRSKRALRRMISLPADPAAQNLLCGSGHARIS